MRGKCGKHETIFPVDVSAKIDGWSGDFRGKLKVKGRPGQEFPLPFHQDSGILRTGLSQFDPHTFGTLRNFELGLPPARLGLCVIEDTAHPVLGMPAVTKSDRVGDAPLYTKTTSAVKHERSEIIFVDAQFQAALLVRVRPDFELREKTVANSISSEAFPNAHMAHEQDAAKAHELTYKGTEVPDRCTAMNGQEIDSGCRSLQVMEVLFGMVCPRYRLSWLSEKFRFRINLLNGLDQRFPVAKRRASNFNLLRPHFHLKDCSRPAILDCILSSPKSHKIPSLVIISPYRIVPITS
jgi:hypothetical protein